MKIYENNNTGKDVMAETVTGISYYNNFPEIMIYKYQVQMVLILMRFAHIISIKPLLKLY